MKIPNRAQSTGNQIASQIGQGCGLVTCWGITLKHDLKRGRQGPCLGGLSLGLWNAPPVMRLVGGPLMTAVEVLAPVAGMRVYAEQGQTLAERITGELVMSRTPVVPSQ